MSGSLAVLRQYFNGQIGNTELVERLLTTANKTGIYADSDTYGQGLVDLDAATAPVGALGTNLPDTANRHLFSESRLALSGGALGNSLQNTLKNVEVAAFDELGAPFLQPAAALIAGDSQNQTAPTAAEQHREQQEISFALSGVPGNLSGNLTGRSAAQNATLSLGFDRNSVIDEARLAFADGAWFSYGQNAGRALGLYADSPSAAGVQRFSDPLSFAAPYLSLVRDGPGIGFSHDFAARSEGGRVSFALMHGTPQFDGGREDPLKGERGLGAVVDVAVNGGFSLQAGAVRETQGFLGARPQGALGKAQGATTFVGVNGDWRMGDHWRTLTSAYVGNTAAQLAGGSLSNSGDIMSSAFSIGAVRGSVRVRGDWFGVRLSQPLRVEKGQVNLRLPSGRTKYGEVTYQDHNIALKPAGRTLQAEVAYQMPIASGALKTSMGVERHPQHDSTKATEPFMRLSFERRF